MMWLNNQEFAELLSHICYWSQDSEYSWTHNMTVLLFTGSFLQCWKDNNTRFFPSSHFLFRPSTTHCNGQECNQNIDVYSSEVVRLPLQYEVYNTSFSDCGHLFENIDTSKPFRCEVCKKTFKEHHNLWQHPQWRKAIQMWNLKQMLHSENTSNETFFHTHTGKKPVSCQICMKSFVDIGGLQKHSITHTGEKLFSCNVCNKSFFYRADLVNTLAYTQEISPLHVKCVKGNLLLVKVMWITQEINLLYVKCVGRGSGNLEKHTRIHTGDQPFTCEVCNRCFSFSGSRVKHTQIHTGDKQIGQICWNTCAFTQGLNLYMQYMYKEIYFPWRSGTTHAYPRRRYAFCVWCVQHKFHSAWKSC